MSIYLKPIAPFWYVINAGEHGRIPSKQHPSEESARAEAERLAAKHPNASIYVVAAVAKYVSTPSVACSNVAAAPPLKCDGVPEIQYEHQAILGEMGTGTFKPRAWVDSVMPGDHVRLIREVITYQGALSPGTVLKVESLNGRGGFYGRDGMTSDSYCVSFVDVELF